MNAYLIRLAGNIQQIRGTLGITQVELANAMGISRPSLVKIEQDPTKLTAVMSFALYVVVSSRFQLIRERISELEVKDFSEKKNFPEFVMAIQKASSLNASSISGIAATTIGTATVSGIPGLINLGLKKGLEFIKNKAETLPTEDIQWNSGVADEWVKKAEQRINTKEAECLQYFELSDWNNLTFMKKLNDTFKPTIESVQEIKET